MHRMMCACKERECVADYCCIQCVAKQGWAHTSASHEGLKESPMMLLMSLSDSMSADKLASLMVLARAMLKQAKPMTIARPFTILNLSQSG